MISLCLRDLNHSSYPVRFHPTGYIDRVTPGIVGKFSFSNYSRYNGTRMNAYPELKTNLSLLLYALLH
jgi:hypothetical protein